MPALPAGTDLRAEAVPPFAIEIESDPGWWPGAMNISLESPAKGKTTNALTIEVQGYVVRRKNCLETRPKSVEFVKGKTSLWSTPIKLARPDVVSYFSDIVDPAEIYCGFNTTLPSFLSTSPGAVRLQVVHEADSAGEERRYPLANISFKPIGERSFEASDAIGVVTVNSLGRSGSSLLCRILDAHLHCVAPLLHGQYGEVSVLGHFLRVAAVLSSEGSMASLNRLETEADFESLSVGYLRMDGEASKPFHDSLMQTVNQHSASLLRGVHEDVAAYARSIKPQARFWVEKTWNQASANLSRVMLKNSREIILIRHVADFWRSQALYLDKINAPPDVIEQHARATFHKYVAIANSYLERPEETLLVRYEELLDDPETECRRVTAHLGLPFTPEFEQSVMSIVGVDDKHSRGLSTAELEYEGVDFYDYLGSFDEPAVQYLKKLLAELGYEL